MDSEAITHAAMKLRSMGCSHMFIEASLNEIVCITCGQAPLAILTYDDEPGHQPLHEDENPHLKVVFSCDCEERKLGVMVNGLVLQISHAAPGHRSYPLQYSSPDWGSRIVRVSHNHSRVFGQPGVLVDPFNPFDPPKPPSG